MSTVDISLDRGSQHTFAPGNRVSGTVTYFVKSGTKQIWDVRIAFVGSIETRVISGDIPRPLRVSDWQGVAEKQPIFRSEQRLVKGPFAAKPERHTYRFEFEIPKKYSPTKPDELATTLVTPCVQQPLPLSLTSGTKSRESSATISYKLQASVVHEKSRRTERAEIPIVVSASSQTALSKPQTYRFKFPLATWNSFRATNPKLSFRQKLSQIAHLGSPSIALDGGLHIPEELSTTQTIDVRFSANQVRMKASDPVYPHLRLKRVSLSLYGFTEVVCWYPDHPKGPQSIRHMHKDEIASQIYVDVGPHDGTIIKLDGSSMSIAPNWCLADFAPKADLVPDFTSALTLHRHSLMANVELFHEESSHVMKLSVEVPIKVLPPSVPEPVRAIPKQLKTPLQVSNSTPTVNVIPPEPASAVPKHIRAPLQASRSRSNVNAMPSKQRSQLQTAYSSSNVDGMPRTRMSQLQGTYSSSAIGATPVQSRHRPHSSYAGSDGRYSLDSSSSIGNRYSVELPAYSPAMEQNPYYSSRSKGNPPAYVELEASNIPPQNELPRILRVVNPSF